MAEDLTYVTFQAAVLSLKVPYDDEGAYVQVQIQGGVTIGMSIDNVAVRVPSLSHFPIGDRLRAKNLTVSANLVDVRTSETLEIAYAGSAATSTVVTTDSAQPTYVGVQVVVTLNAQNATHDTLTFEIPYAACISEGDVDLDDSEEGHGFPMRFEARAIDSDTAPATITLASGD